MSNEYVEKFADLPLFEGLTPIERMELLKIREEVSAPEQALVIRQGTPGDGFYVIGSGVFEVLKSGKHDEVLARLEKNSYFGEMSLVTNDLRSASVLCTQEGRLHKFPTDRFRTLLEEGSLPAYKVVLNMCRILARRLAAMDDQIVS